MSAAAREFRYRTFWLATGWGLIGALVVLSLMPSPPEPFSFQWSDTLEHALAYGLLMGWFMQLYPARLWLRVAAALIGLGIGLEFLQACTETRRFDLIDMAADAFGVLLVRSLLRPPYTELLGRLDRRLDPR